MEPSPKSPGMEQMLEAMQGFDRRQYIRNDQCVPAPIGCGRPITPFRDLLSEREFSISGLCQSCQNSVFGG